MSGIAGKSPTTAPKYVWGMLAIRSALSFAMLLAVAAAYSVFGTEKPFAAASAWWLWYVTIVNVVCISLMARFGRREGLRLRDVYNINRSTWKGDLLWLIGAFAGTAVVAQLPGTLIAKAFWGTANVPNSMLFGPLPIFAVYPLFILMPVSHALAELPTYWGFVAPRLKSGGMNRWLVILVVGLGLSLQHLFFSFQPDIKYALWLAFKFFPFALFTGFVIDRRPTLLPYMMAVHMLLDSLLPYLALIVSRGGSLAM